MRGERMDKANSRLRGKAGKRIPDPPEEPRDRIMANDAGSILKRIEDEEIDWVDLRFTDPKGKWQHLTMASAAVDEDQLTDGFMFDGSSIAGWKAINESDMILKPDLDAAYVDPFSATPMMMLVPQPRWQHYSAVRITSTFPVQSKL